MDPRHAKKDIARGKHVRRLTQKEDKLKLGKFIKTPNSTLNKTKAVLRSSVNTSEASDH